MAELLDFEAMSGLIDGPILRHYRAVIAATDSTLACESELVQQGPRAHGIRFSSTFLQERARIPPSSISLCHNLEAGNVSLEFYGMYRRPKTMRRWFEVALEPGMQIYPEAATVSIQVDAIDLAYVPSDVGMRIREGLAAANRLHEWIAKLYAINVGAWITNIPKPWEDAALSQWDFESARVAAYSPSQADICALGYALGKKPEDYDDPGFRAKYEKYLERLQRRLRSSGVKPS